MIYDHIVFPGAIDEIIDEAQMVLADLESKGASSSGVGRNVDVSWYGGGYVSNIEEKIRLN